MNSSDYTTTTGTGTGTSTNGYSGYSSSNLKYTVTSTASEIHNKQARSVLTALLECGEWEVGLRLAAELKRK